MSAGYRVRQLFYYFFSNFLPYLIVIGLALWLRHVGFAYWWAAFFVVIVITKEWVPAPWKQESWRDSAN